MLHDNLIRDMAESTAKAINDAVAPLLKEIESLKERNELLERRLDQAPDPMVVANAAIRVVEDELKEVKNTVDEIVIPELPDIHGMIKAAVDALPREPGPPGERGPAALGIADVFRGEGGHVIVTLENGITRDLGSMKGEKGEPGSTGEAGLQGETGPQGEKGEAGVGFDEADLVFNEKGVFLRLARGETNLDLPLPLIHDRGVWKDGEEYSKGSAVSHHGSMWIAQEETRGEPSVSPDWRLAVKRGRDGKRGPEGKPGIPPKVDLPFGDK